jgi:hypothetical protein
MLRVVGLPVRTRRDVLPYGFLSINPQEFGYQGQKLVATDDSVDSKKRQENLKVSR